MCCFLEDLDLEAFRNCNYVSKDALLERGMKNKV